MTKINDYKDLLVWQKAMNLVVEVYKTTKMLPKEETYSLSDQMRRAAVSIPSNIAEGYGRQTQKSYAQFLTIARGSAFELETQILLCRKIYQISSEITKSLLSAISEITKMLTSLINKIHQYHYESNSLS
jgi:four helix bundle protein